MTSPWRHHTFDFCEIHIQICKRRIKATHTFQFDQTYECWNIYNRKVNKELWRKKWILSLCDLALWPKVINFKRVWASGVSNRLAKTASKSMHSFGCNFGHKQSWTHTHQHTHRQTAMKILPNPSTFRWDVKYFGMNWGMT